MIRPSESVDPLFVVEPSAVCAPCMVGPPYAHMRAYNIMAGPVKSMVRTSDPLRAFDRDL